MLAEINQVKVLKSLKLEENKLNIKKYNSTWQNYQHLN